VKGSIRLSVQGIPKNVVEATRKIQELVLHYQFFSPRYFQSFVAEATVILFEGSTSDMDDLEFQTYSLPLKNIQHQYSRLHVAILHSPSTIWEDAQEFKFKAAFYRQLRRLKQLYDQEQFGQLKAQIRCGTHYVVNYLAGERMSIKEFESQVKKGLRNKKLHQKPNPAIKLKSLQRISSSSPTSTSPRHALTTFISHSQLCVLLQMNPANEEEEYYSISAIHGGEEFKFKFSYANLKLETMRERELRWFAADLISENETGKSIIFKDSDCRY
jgi:hypothetical protein